MDVILAGGSVGAEAAKRATSSIPIVAAGVGDLVELGLVTSLARPSGNLTGFVATDPEIAGKRFQIVKEIRPEAKRAAVLWNPNSSNAQLEWQVAERFAAAWGGTSSPRAFAVFRLITSSNVGNAEFGRPPLSSPLTARSALRARCRRALLHRDLPIRAAIRHPPLVVADRPFLIRARTMRFVRQHRWLRINRL